MSYCIFLNQFNLTNDQSITIPTLQSLTTITQESANDERVEEDPETICYPDRAPCKDGYLIYTAITKVVYVLKCSMPSMLHLLM